MIERTKKETLRKMKNRVRKNKIKRDLPNRSLKNLIFPNVNLTRYAIFDATAFIFLLGIRLPIHKLLEEAFGKNTQVAVCHSTLFELRNRAKSHNKTTREKANLAIWFIKEFDIPVKGYVQLSKHESYLKMGLKRNYRLVTHAPNLVGFLHQNKIQTHHIHPFKTTGWRITKLQPGQSIGGLQTRAFVNDLKERVQSLEEVRRISVMENGMKKHKRKVFIHNLKAKLGLVKTPLYERKKHKPKTKKKYKKHYTRYTRTTVAKKKKQTLHKTKPKRHYTKHKKKSKK